jgi:ABC-type nitrate/sulfonate/bicarbonate transport system substrate-binding protein
MTQRNLFRWIAMLSLFALIAVACGDGDTAEEPAAEEPAAEEPAAEEPAAEEPAAEEPAAEEPAAEEPADPTELRVRLSWVVDPGFMGIYEAEVQGFFDDENLSVTIEHGGPNVPNAVQAVAGGAADIGITDPFTLALAMSEGGDYIVFGVRMQSDPTGIGSLCDDPINSPADIAGKKIAGGTTDGFLIDALLVANGLEPGTYELVPAGWDMSPVLDGTVDGMLIWVNSHPLPLDADGICNVKWTFSEFGLPAYQDLFFTTREFFDANRGALEGFLRANVKGWETAFNDPAHAIDLVMNTFGGVDLGLIEADQFPIHEAQIPLMTSPLTNEKGLFWFDLDQIQNIQNGFVLAATGLDSIPDAADVYDISILEAIYAGCGASLLDC